MFTNGLSATKNIELEEVSNRGIEYLTKVSDRSVSKFKNSKELANSKSSKRIINGMTKEKSNNQSDIIQIKDFMPVQRVVRKINSILDTKELLKQIVEDVSQTLGFTRCAIMLYDEIQDTLDIAALTGWEDKSFEVGYKISSDSGIIWKAFTENRVVYYQDVIDLPVEELCDFTSRSHVDIPLVQHGKLIGLLNAQHWETDAFSKHDLRILKMLASHIAIALENSRLFELERKEKESMLRELKEASDIQSRLFPKNAPETPNFNIEGMCEPCLEVGGDWFDYIQLPSGKIGVVLADVAGKGLGASLLMSSARTIIRMVTMQEKSPAEVLRKVNEILTGDIPPARFITMVYAVIDPETQKITVANAGHHYPVIYSDKTAEYLIMEAGLPLGIKTHYYREYNFTLHPGNKLFLYSDGVPEAMNSKKEFFGEKRLASSLKKQDANVKSLFNDVKNFVGETNLSDDLTIVMIESL
jgi:sigma-B regulation protein RsbU (phosphoserine phosphatase)